MERDHHDQGHRQEDYVEGVPPDQGGLGDLIAPQQGKLHLLADEGRRLGDVGPHGDGPVGQLVPREQVASKAQEEGEDEEGHPHHPVELPGRLVGPGVEDPGHVEDMLLTNFKGNISFFVTLLNQIQTVSPLHLQLLLDDNSFVESMDVTCPMINE